MEIQYVTNMEKASHISNRVVQFPPDWLQDKSLRIKKIQSYPKLDPDTLRNRRLKTIDAASPLRWLKKWNVFQHSDNNSKKIVSTFQPVVVNKRSFCLDQDSEEGTNHQDVKYTTATDMDEDRIDNPVSGMHTDNVTRVSKRLRYDEKKPVPDLQPKSNQTEFVSSTNIGTDHVSHESCSIVAKVQSNQQREIIVNEHQVVQTEEIKNKFKTRISGLQLILDCPKVASMIQTDPTVRVEWIDNPIAYNDRIDRVYYGGFSIINKQTNCKLYMGDYIEISTQYLIKPRTAQIVSCYQATNPQPVGYIDKDGGGAVIVQEKGTKETIYSNSTV
jgi:hypothetical protein